MYGRKGIRHASLVYIEVELKGLARGAAELCASAPRVDSCTSVQTPTTEIHCQHLAVFRFRRELGLLRLYCNSADETAAGRAKENFPDPRSIRHSLRTDNFAYIIQVYIIPNTSSHGIMNIT